MKKYYFFYFIFFIKIFALNEEKDLTFKKRWNQLITVITDEENKITTASILTGIVSYSLFKKITLMQVLTKRFPSQ